MHDHELYQQILGLTAPWKVHAVRLELAQRRIEVQVQCTESTWACPQSQCRMHIQDWDQRRWRHLDSCEFQTLIVTKVPRVRCPEHGTLTVQVPWAGPYGRFTKRFERLAIDLLQECSISAVCEGLRISWDEADGIKQRVVARGVLRKQTQPVRRLGVDEKSAGRGQNYVTVGANLEPGRSATMEYVGDGRTQEKLEAYWQERSPEHRAAVEAVAMDLWAPYFQATVQHVPEAAGKIIHDTYYLSQMLGRAVDRVRRAEHRALSAAGEERLAGTKYVWLYGWENLPGAHQQRFDQLRGQKLRTSRTWGDQGDVPRLLGQPDGRGREGVLPLVVQLGDPLALGPHQG